MTFKVSYMAVARYAEGIVLRSMGWGVGFNKTKDTSKVFMERWQQNSRTFMSDRQVIVGHSSNPWVLDFERAHMTLHPEQ